MSEIRETIGARGIERYESFYQESESPPPIRHQSALQKMAWEMYQYGAGRQAESNEAQQQVATEQSAEEQDPIKQAMESLRRALAFLERPAEVFDTLQKENKKLKGIINFVDGAVSCAEDFGDDQTLAEAIRVKIPAKKKTP